MPESSVVIPVCNKWDLTRKCLKNLAANTDRNMIEVIVVDNASTDATSQACEFLGRQLFGDNFRYIRNDSNRNFAGASNQGAKAATGEFLIFLNNDTEVQPGWYRPLIEDFTTYPDLAATGPLLVYPEETPFGRTVQHLGVFISPSLKFGHLYEGIPAASPLARKRRFFHVITAACLAIKKALFMETGMFDERFVNGFADVDLCLRIGAQGRRFTVNPNSLVIHHQSQTLGRHSREEDNSSLLRGKCSHLFTPDWHIHAKNDDLVLGPNEWLMYQIMLPDQVAAKLAPLLDKAGISEIRKLLVAYPYWKAGWERAFSLAATPHDKIAILRPYFKLFHNPENAMRAYSLGRETGDSSLAKYGYGILRSFEVAPENFLATAFSQVKWCQEIGLGEIAGKHLAWADNYERFVTTDYARYARNLMECARNEGLVMDTLNDHAYAIWLHGRDATWHGPTPGTNRESMAFSILMPVYNPIPEHLKAALDSVLNQTWQEWELCIADDASTNPEVHEIIKEYAAKDRRIKTVFRKNNGHIAEATNTALDMAEKRWCAFMDQDDLLAPEALAAMASAISCHPGAMLLYSDEDKVGELDRRFCPYFKSRKWDWELAGTQNFVCHLAVYDRQRLMEKGGLRKGFEGAQDYDLLLRYATGLDESQIIHVPLILYHWRAHGTSTALSINAKDYAGANTVKAAQAWLDTVSPGALALPVAGSPWIRTRYPVPEDIQCVSLLVPLTEACADPRPFLETVHRKNSYDVDLIFVCSPDWAKELENRFPGIPARFLETEKTGWEALNEAATAARGSILGFVGPDVVPCGEDWLDEIAGALWRPGIGAVGGKTMYPDGSIVDAGWLADCTGILKPLFSGMRITRYFGWAMFQRTVDALGGDCIFTRKDDFLREGGFNAAMGCMSAQDYCLRLGPRGLRSVWWPYAEFLRRKPLAAEKFPTPLLFHEVWAGKLKPFNPNVLIFGELLALSLSKTPPDDFQAQEYLRLYPDVAAAGVDPLEHYIRHGRPEGRKGRMSRIDYSGLTPERVAKWNSSPRNGVVVCTALCGDYDQLLPPAYLNDGWEYVCYSDKPRNGYDIWDIRDIPYTHHDPTRMARWVKTHLPELFPDAKWVIWMDANIVITDDMSSLLHGKGADALYLARHFTRDCLYTEGRICVRIGKEDGEVMKRQLDEYKAAGMPEHFGLYETPVMLLDPRAEMVGKVFSAWAKEIEKHGKRDQVSLPYVLYRTNAKPAELFPYPMKVQSYPAYAFLTHRETRWISPPKIASRKISAFSRH